MTDRSPANALTVVDRAFREACAEIDRRVRCGESHVAETWVNGPGPIPSNADLVAELIFTEYATREAHGQIPDPAEYYARFPALADRLRRMFEVDVLLREDGIADGPKDGSQHIGPYEVRERLGAGGMGIVYRGWDPKLHRDVAIKVLGPAAEKDDCDRFLKEGRAVARLNHPHIIQLYEVGEQEGQPFLAMEYVAGGTLRDRLRDQLLPVTEAAKLLATLAEAVHYAHSQGILHRDLKPGNVLLAGTADSSTLMPKVSDFGLATRLDRSAGSITVHQAGTPGYMAPEQSTGEGRLTAAADVYALGAILYEALVGRTPFLGDSPSETLLKLLHEEPVPPRRIRAEVPRDLETICLKCLNKEPTRRYATAADLAADLRRFLASEPIVARPIGALQRFVKFARRRPVLTATLAVALLALIVIAVGSVEFTRRLRHEAIETKAERDRADGERQVADGRRIEAESERQKALELLAINREYQYVARLLQVAGMRSTDPLRARELLASEEWCPPERRDFAWHYLAAACQVDVFKVAAESGGVNALAVSPDGRLVATAGMDGSVRVWDARTGNSIHVFAKAHAGKASAIVFVPDGKAVISAGLDGVVRSWDLTTAKMGIQLGKLPCPVYALIVDPRSGTVYAAGGRQGLGGRVSAWNMDGSAVRAAPPNETAVVRCLALASERGEIVMGLDSGEIVRWSIGKSSTVLRFLSNRNRVRALAVHADGTIATAHPFASRVSFWEGSSGRKLRDLDGSFGWSLQFSPDGQMLAVGEPNGYVTMCRASDAQKLVTLRGHRREFLGMRLPELAENSLAGDGVSTVAGVVFTNDGQLVSAGADDTLRGWRLDPSPIPFVGPPIPVAASSLIVLPSGRDVFAAGRDNRIHRVDLTTGALKPVTPASETMMSGLMLSADSRCLLASNSRSLVPLNQSPETIVRAWPLPDLTSPSVGVFPTQTPFIDSAPDGTVWATGPNGIVYRWMPGAGNPIACGQHPDAPGAAAYLTRLGMFVTASQAHILGWSQDADPPHAFAIAFPGRVREMFASPDGHTVIVRIDEANRKLGLYVWDALRDTAPRRMDISQFSLTALTFSADGRTIAAAGADRTLRLVNVTTDDTLLAFAERREPISGVAFLPKNRGLVALRVTTAPKETRVVQWVIDPVE
jgi:eukaryotic-like serine/threonine-protein kinase